MMVLWIEGGATELDLLLLLLLLALRKSEKCALGDKNNGQRVYEYSD